MQDTHFNVLIVGGGPAGLTAAVYAARAGLSVCVLDPAPGGAIASAHLVENFPAFPDGIGGYELADNMRRTAEKQGVTFVDERAVGADLTASPKIVRTKTRTFTATAVILSMGTEPRRLGLDGEARLLGHGVSVCAACDGAFFRGRDVAVVGGGNTAAGDALYLSAVARSVTLIHRRAELRADRVLQNGLAACPNVTLLLEATVTALHGEAALTAVTVAAPQGERTLPVSGLFVAVGSTPHTAWLGGALPLTADGYIKTDGVRTAVPNVFACGDVRDTALRQVVTAAADGALAASLVDLKK
ncbi:MAG: FAD-dependent oxidoreductase [Clostridiales bacterium]|jgi:thioredoxin reductase (NADPH)|nr:FAD-dependent oxidoreductase [Clostridiales bacterium]